ncbi:unnamed protein product [Tetraodon nigroviridis]|uniref:(spotted green pufferfish) hypothetical protein n=1 Tax=Tetraodon nigroviridis TaxID=99883 RepID=Q4SDK4_TETNG|nr:unnamed protein product [Tetraodon nigroviridis]
MKLSLLVACVLWGTLCAPHHMVSAIYVPPEMMPAGAPVESSNNADAQTRSLGGAARGSSKQGIPRLSGGAEVNPLVMDLPDPAAAAPVGAAADPVLLVPAAPAVPVVPAVPVAPSNPSGPQAPVVVPFADDDDDDDDD